METPRDLDSIADRQERQGAKIIFRALKMQYTEMAKQVENGQDPQPNRDIIKNALTQFYSRAAYEMADWQFNRLTREYSAKALQMGIEERVLDAIRTWILGNTGASIKSISDTSLEQVRKVLIKAQEAGFGARKIGQLIRAEAKGNFTAYRSTVIARTEGTRAASIGTEIGAKQWENVTGQKKWKAWSASADSRTRDSHLAMIDSKPIPGDEDFIINGKAMSGPGDPAGGASECVNCRCRKYYMSERVANRINGVAPKPVITAEPVAKPVPAEPVAPVAPVAQPYALTPEKIQKLEAKGIKFEGEPEDINSTMGGFNFEEFDDDIMKMLKANGITNVKRSVQNFGSSTVIMEYRSIGEDARKFRLNRIFRKSGDLGSVEHDLFVLDTSLQGTGISKKTFQSLYKQYNAAGITKIDVHANINVGGYTWAKYGFEPVGDAESLYRECRQNVAAYHGENSAEYKDLMTILNSDDPTKLNKIANTKYGKKALLGSDWYGTINLKNNTQRKIFEDYLK